MYIWFTRHSRFAHHWMVLSLGTAWKGRWIRVLPAPEKAPGMFPLGFEWYRNNVFDGLVLNLVSGLEHVLFFHIFLAISCPYSRAEHIPCQNSWENSGNCEDPFQVKFVFHTVCQVLLFFWHVRCRLHMFFPKEDPYFQQFLEMS